MRRSKQIRRLALFGRCLAVALVSVLAVSFADTKVQPRETYVLIVGIDNYADPQFRIWGSGVSGAFDLRDLFLRIGLVKADNAIVLTDAGASREAITAAIRRVIGATAKNEAALFVFHFSGWSQSLTKSNGEREWYLVPADFLPEQTPGTKASAGKPDETTLEKRAISARLLNSWISQIQAQSQLIIFDSNHVEDAVPAFVSHVRSEGDESIRLSGRQIEVFGPRHSASSGTNFDGIEQSALTGALIKGLNGAADLFPKDGEITAEELRIYASGEMLAEYNNPDLVSTNIGGDFTIKAGYGESSRGVKPAPPPAPPPSQESQPKNYALLIATDHYYAWKQLSNPVFDATTLGKDLKDYYGFETELVIDPTKTRIREALAKYQKVSFSPDDQLVVFIAGHGKYDEDSGEGMLVAADSKEDDPDDRTYFSLETLRGMVDKIPANHILLLLDSCFSGAFADPVGAPGARGDLYTKLTPLELKRRILKHKSRLYLTSGGKEYVPDGRPGQHSPFARKVLDALERAGDRRDFVTFDTLKANLALVKPEPHAGEFGSSETGANFIFIATK
jgi:hypothetical protein